MLGTDLESRAFAAGNVSACRWRLTLAAAAFALVASSVDGAHAQSAENVAAARALGKKGVTLARADKCAEALDPLSRAEELFHAPTILVELGYCQCVLGRVVEGTEALNRVARENLGDAPPPAFVAAQDRARKLLNEYQGKVASLVIHVDAPQDATFVVTVDGKEVPSALLGAPRPTDPGTHEVRAEGEGLAPAAQSVTLDEGGSGSVDLVLTATAPSEAMAAGQPQDPEEGPIEERHVQAVLVDDGSPPREPNRVPAYVGFGVGAVGIAAGTYFGFSAKSTKNELDDVCRGGSCPSGYDDEISGMTRDANLSTIGFAVGILGLGAGVYFWLTADSDANSAFNQCTDEPCIRPVVGLGQLGAQGVF